MLGSLSRCPEGFQVLAGIRVVEGFAVVFGLGLDVFVTNVANTPAYTPALNVTVDVNTRLWPILVLGIMAL